MSTKPRTPNLTLRGIREQLGMTRVEFAEALGRTSYELGGTLEPTERSITRLENGEVTWPQAAYRQALEALCGRPITELGFTPRARSADGGGPVAPIAPVGHTSAGDQLAGSQWPTWFGIRLAQLIGLADGWRYQNGQISALQGILAEEITMINASAPAPGGPDSAVFDQSRRQALTTLAALPMAFSTASVLAANGKGMAAAQESFLAQCTASMTACWQLLGGSDLTVVDEVLTSYLVPLEGIAHQHSKYQRAAATLACQAHRMRGIVALHLKQLALYAHHAQQALRYATMASDVSGQVQAFSSLGQAYFYSSDPGQALVTFERLSALESKMPPQRRSRLQSELAAVYGQLGREQEALTAAGRAEDLYPDHPDNDPDYLYSDPTPAMLSLRQAFAYLALAEQHEGRGYQNKAAEILGRVDQVEAGVSDRVRYEIANHQARAAVLLDDMDAFELYIHRGLDGAVLLSSRQRLREAQQAWQMATQRWPNERRLTAVTGRLQIAAGNSGENDIPNKGKRA